MTIELTDALAGLAQQWRAQVRYGTGAGVVAVRECAKELEALLASPRYTVTPEGRAIAAAYKARQEAK